jgi:hypothetical protein
VPGQIRPGATVHRRGSLPCAAGRKLARPRHGGPVQPQSDQRARARDGVVARSSMSRWWLAGGNVLPVSSWGPPGGRRARRGLTGQGGGKKTGACIARVAVGGGERGGKRRERGRGNWHLLKRRQGRGGGLVGGRTERMMEGGGGRQRDAWLWRRDPAGDRDPTTVGTGSARRRTS